VTTASSISHAYVWLKAGWVLSSVLKTACAELSYIASAAQDFMCLRAVRGGGGELVELGALHSFIRLFTTENCFTFGFYPMAIVTLFFDGFFL
jgi:hypothetical protein